MSKTGAPNETGTGLSAGVLAGGMSRRMGTDKALLPLRPGDPPLAQVVLRTAGAIADDLFVVASGRPEYAAFGVPVVPDRYAEAGTLGGIATALAAARHDRCLIVACDMPFLSLPLLRWMSEQPGDYDVLVPRVPGESRQGPDLVYQTLHAIYSRDCLPAIERRLAEGQRKVIGFFDDVRVRVVDLDTIRSLDPDLRSFFNANTPAAVEEARALLAAGPEPGGVGRRNPE